LTDPHVTPQDGPGPELERVYFLCCSECKTRIREISLDDEALDTLDIHLCDGCSLRKSNEGS